jgi:amidase
MRILGKDRLSYYFGEDTGEPFYVQPGEIFGIESKDCFEEVLQKPEDLENPTTFDFVINHRCPVTGPVYVKNAEKGDLLRVDIKEINIADKVVTCIGPEMEEDPHRLFPKNRAIFYEVKDNMIAINEDLVITIKPMVGTIGVAPKDERLLSFKQGKHGGNMDCSEVRAGSSLYLPVFVEGGLLALGDIHAIQADGEVGMPFEVSGTVVLSVDLIKERPATMHWPRLENDKYRITLVSEKTFEVAAIESQREMLRWLREDYGWNNEDIFIFLTMVADPRVCQFACPLVTVRCVLPKKYLP